MGKHDAIVNIIFPAGVWGYSPNSEDHIEVRQKSLHFDGRLGENNNVVSRQQGETDSLLIFYNESNHLVKDKISVSTICWISNDTKYT